MVVSEIKIEDRGYFPDSVKFDAASKPQIAKHDDKPCWEFKVGFRAKNAFGGVVRSVAWIYWANGEVIDAKLNE